jgi:hypothetical protein
MRQFARPVVNLALAFRERCCRCRATFELRRGQFSLHVPSQLKAWIDRIVVRGKTFQYGANGPEGLAGNKRVVIAVSRGGFYGAGAPTAALEHLET